MPPAGHLLSEYPYGLFRKFRKYRFSKPSQRMDRQGHKLNSLNTVSNCRSPDMVKTTNLPAANTVHLAGSSLRYDLTI